MGTKICLNYPIGEDNYFIRMEYSHCFTRFLKTLEELIIALFWSRNGAVGRKK